MREHEIKQIYFSITELSEKFQVSPSMIRLWDDELGLNAKRQGHGNARMFKEHEVKVLSKAAELYKTGCYTIEGIKFYTIGQGKLIKIMKHFEVKGNSNVIVDQSIGEASF